MNLFGNSLRSVNRALYIMNFKPFSLYIFADENWQIKVCCIVNTIRKGIVGTNSHFIYRLCTYLLTFLPSISFQWHEYFLVSITLSTPNLIDCGCCMHIDGPPKEAACKLQRNKLFFFYLSKLSACLREVCYALYDRIQKFRLNLKILSFNNK